MQKRRKYSEEFKREAVSFANQAGVTAKQVGEELGINANMIGRWRRELGICMANSQSRKRIKQLAYRHNEHTNNPTQATHPNPFHHIIRVECVNYVGLIWRFYPG